MLSMPVLLLRAALLLISFTGLCAALRVRFRLEAPLAPFVTVSGVIAVLMPAGMLGLLLPCLILLYALGFAGFIYAYLLRRQRPAWGLIAAMLVFVVYLALRYYPAKLYLNDDVSHWGLVARHLLRYDRFPTGADDYVFFQSYPLGAACFIYYVARFLGDAEGLYYIAQNFLLGALFLPVLCVARKNRRLCSGLALGSFALLFHYFRQMQTLQVDLQLAFFGIGIVACVAALRSEPRKALLAVIPALIAVVYVKNSGLFFSFCGMLALCLLFRRRGLSRRKIACTALIAIGLPLLFYLFWSLHIRLRFPAALESKHAVSLSAYAREVQAKGLGTILRILKAVAQGFVHANSTVLKTFAFALASMAAVLLCCKQDRCGLALRPVLRRVAYALGVYILWVVMVVLMYIFSMPVGEAVRAASFYRYNGTGLAFLTGLLLMIVLDVLGRMDAPIPAPVRLLRWGALALTLVYAIGPFVPALQSHRSFARVTEYEPIRAELRAARQQVPDGGRYLVYVSLPADYALIQDGETDYSGVFEDFYHLKYEFESGNICYVIGNGPYEQGTLQDNCYSDDCTTYLADTIDGCDGFFLFDDGACSDPQINAFLDAYDGDTPIFHISKNKA